MTSLNSFFDGRLVDPDYRSHSYVARQTGRTGLVPSDHKVDPKLQDFDLHCLLSEQMKTNDRGRLKSNDDESLIPQIGGVKPNVPSSATIFPYICPFFLRHPERWGAMPSCSGDVWVDFQKLKEHVIRSHKLPVRCERCSVEFQDMTELVAHLLYKENECQATSHSPVRKEEGCNKAQAKALKSMNPIGLTAFERWSEMWRILFPGDAEGDIPNPSMHSLSQYVLSNLKDSMSRPSNSITVEEIQANLRKTLKIDQPGSILDLPTSNNNSGITLPTNYVPPLENPFIHRGLRNDSAPRPVAVTDLSSVTISTIPSEIEPLRRQEWPLDASFKERQGVQHSKTNTTALLSLPNSQWQHVQRQFSPNPQIHSQVPFQNGKNPNPSSISKNPFYGAASRAPTPSPLRRASEASAYSSFPTATRVSEYQKRINETFFTEVDKVLNCVATTNSSSSKPALDESLRSPTRSASVKDMSDYVPKHLDQNQEILPDKALRSSVMSRSSSSEGQFSPIESAKDKLKHKRNLQPLSGELLSWPQTSSIKSNFSADGVSRSCASSKSSESSANCLTPSTSEFISESEEIYDSSEDSCSSPLDSTSDTVRASVPPMQHRATKQSAGDFSFTHHSSNTGRSRSANSGSRSSRSTSNSHSSITSATHPAGGPHGQGIESTQSPDEESGKEEGEAEDDEENERQCPNEENYAKRKFACPYYAREPSRHFKYRSCSRSGWDTVHRVKEHVYLRHKLPPVCPRCYKMFSDKDELNNHFRTAADCEIKTLSYDLSVEGFNEEKEKALRKRAQGVTEEEKWNDMYRILFPDGAENDIPEPYYGAATPLDQHMRRTRPQLLIQDISALFEKYHGPINAELKEEIASIPGNVEAEARRSYHVGPLNTQTSDGQEIATTRMALGSPVECISSKSFSTAVQTTRRKSDALDNQPLAIASKNGSRQRRPTQLDSIEDTPARQFRSQTHSTMLPRRHSISASTLHAQHPSRQSFFGQFQDDFISQSTEKPTSELQLLQNHFIPSQLTSNYSYTPSLANIGSIQSENWNHASPHQVGPAFHSWSPGYPPCPRPGTTPPIASMSQYGTSPSINAPYGTSPLNATPSTTTDANQSYPVPSNISTDSYTSPQFLQGSFTPPQSKSNSFQPQIADQSYFSARHQSQNPFIDSQPFAMPQTQSPRSTRGRNPFGTFSRIDEELIEQTDEPAYEGFGQAMERSF